MANVRLNWVNSTPSSRQRAIARTVIEARTSPSLPWSTVNAVDAPTTTLLVQDIAPGEWEFRATEVDVGNVPAVNQKTVSIDIAFDPPSGVTEFTASLE